MRSGNVGLHFIISVRLNLWSLNNVFHLFDFQQNVIMMGIAQSLNFPCCTVLLSAVDTSLRLKTSLICVY